MGPDTLSPSRAAALRRTLRPDRPVLSVEDPDVAQVVPCITAEQHELVAAGVEFEDAVLTRVRRRRRRELCPRRSVPLPRVALVDLVLDGAVGPDAQSAEQIDVVVARIDDDL